MDGPLLNTLFRYSKFVALAGVLFLLSANLDNVPDCPELFNANLRSSRALQVVHHNAGVVPEAVPSAWEKFCPPKPDPRLSAHVSVYIAPPCIYRSVRQAADSSPPTV